jgi:hypothetical protein
MQPTVARRQMIVPNSLPMAAGQLIRNFVAVIAKPD